MREKLKDKKFLATITLGERRKKVGANDVNELIAKIIHGISSLTGMKPEQFFNLNAEA